MNYQGYPQPQFPERQPQPPTPYGQTQWGQQSPPPYNGQPFPNYAYPPQIPLPPPPKPVRKRGVNKIGWITASAIILICLLLITLMINAWKGSKTGILGASHNNASNQTTPALQPTAFPTLAPTPTYAPGYGYHMTIGHSYTCTTWCFIDNPTNSFNISSQFAFIVLMFQPMNTTYAQLLIVKLGDMGSESIVYTQGFSLADPNENNLWNTYPTSSLMGSNSYGNYRIEIEDSTSIKAYADFIYEQ